MDSTNKTKIISWMLIFMIIVSLMPIGVYAADEKSYIQTFSLSTVSNKPLSFSASDFTNSVVGEDTLTGIIITGLPAANTGSINYRSRALACGDVIPCDSLGELSFIPKDESKATKATLEFIPIFESGGISTRTSVDIQVISAENTAPVCEDVTIETYKNVAMSGQFLANDAEGDSMTYSLTSEPKRGSVEILDNGTFIYTPVKNKVGKDSFTYVATDANGNISKEAAIKVQIKKPSTKLTYADMEGNPAYYAALRLDEAGLFTGEKIGGSYVFSPDKEVTRGEFLTMVLNMIQMTNIDASTTTNFADDAATPVWVKPYITTALKSGIISGVTTLDGDLVFRSEAYLTQAEAAVIINNALKISDSTTATAAFSRIDDDSIPAWAYQATANLKNYGIIPAGIDGSNMLKTVTRAEAAQMLVSAMDLLEKQNQDKSLLSWAMAS